MSGNLKLEEQRSVSLRCNSIRSTGAEDDFSEIIQFFDSSTAIFEFSGHKAKKFFVVVADMLVDFINVSFHESNRLLILFLGSVGIHCEQKPDHEPYVSTLHDDSRMSAVCGAGFAFDEPPISRIRNLDFELDAHDLLCCRLGLGGAMLGRQFNHPLVHFDKSGVVGKLDGDEGVLLHDLVYQFLVVHHNELAGRNAADNVRHNFPALAESREQVIVVEVCLRFHGIDMACRSGGFKEIPLGGGEKMRPRSIHFDFGVFDSFSSQSVGQFKVTAGATPSIRPSR